MDYKEEYIEKNPNLHKEDAPLKFNDIKKELEKLNFKTSSFIDVGCGCGELTKLLYHYLQPETATGIDISEVMINSAKKNNKKLKIKWVQEDVFGFKSAEKYDLVICADIVEHIDDDIKFLKKVSSFGKIILIRAPLEDSKINYLLKKLNISDELKKTEERYGHTHHYSVEKIINRVNRANLAVTSFSLFKIDKKRSWWFNEIIRFSVNFFIAPFSKNLAIRLAGGFIVLSLTKNDRIKHN